MFSENCVKTFLYALTKTLFLFINDVNEANNLTRKRKGLINIKLFVRIILASGNLLNIFDIQY